MNWDVTKSYNSVDIIINPFTEVEESPFRNTSRWLVITSNISSIFVYLVFFPTILPNPWPLIIVLAGRTKTLRHSGRGARVGVGQRFQDPDQVPRCCFSEPRCFLEFFFFFWLTPNLLLWILFSHPLKIINRTFSFVYWPSENLTRSSYTHRVTVSYHWVTIDKGRSYFPSPGRSQPDLVSTAVTPGTKKSQSWRTFVHSLRLRVRGGSGTT